MSGRIRRFAASVTYPVGRDSAREEFPVQALDPAAANDLALAYVLQVLKLKDFELRVVGS